MGANEERFGLAGPAVLKAVENRQLTRAMEHLMGLVGGIVADSHLHDSEIQFLSTWLAANRAVCDQFPGSAIARAVRNVLADGRVTDDERQHLLMTLQGLSGTHFALTGSVESEVVALPIEDDVTVRLPSSTVCFTGEFLFGTRAACERVTLAAGAGIADTVTRRLEYLVIGTRVSPNWVGTSFGRKIQRAVALQEEGHAIEIISEQRWLEALAA